MYRMDVRRAVISVWSKSVVVFGLGLLALFVPAARAQTVVSQGPLNYFQNYFVTGDYVVGGVGGLSTLGPNPTATINFSGVPCISGPGLFAGVVPCTAKGAAPADIIAAFLYWETIEPTSSTTPTATTGTFDANLSNPNASFFNPSLANEPMVAVPLGSPQVPACVAGGGTESTNSYVRVYRADVLQYLNINSTSNVRTANYTHTITFSGNPTGTVFNGATLVVVYRLVAAGNPRIAPLRSVVFFDGAFTGVASNSPSLNQTMPGFFQASTSADAKMTQIVGGATSKFTETLTVNGNGGSPQEVSNPFVGAQGADWDNYTFNYNLAAGDSSVQTEVQSSKDCLSWAAIITSTNVQDSDFDGLLDIWEESGLYFNPGFRNDGIPPSKIVTPTAPASFGTCTGNAATCVNFKAMGAKVNVPDIFIQIDWMQSNGLSVPNHTHNPQLAALNMVGAVFQSHGINMHFDVGGSSTYQGQGSPYIIPSTYAAGGNVVQESNVLCPTSVSCNFSTPGPPPLTLPQSDNYSVLGWKAGFGSIKDGDPLFPSPPGPVGGLVPLFNVNRKDSFHYALFAHAIAATTPLSTPYAGSISGVADLPGGDFMVTFGLWRSDVAAVDQVGTVLEQAGTLMHELGHNLDLHHGGWNNTPICMPNYPSVMNYMYQVVGLTDASGNEHLDYSYGLDLPLSEDFLSSAIPMGIQNYKVRYFGPYNSAIDTPGQASQVFCSGDLLNSGSISGEGKYVLLQGPAVSTPDWSNGTVKLGTIITSGLDINYDGIGGETFIDTPDWLSLNLQQVGARANAYGTSSDLGKSDGGGTSLLGKSDGGGTSLGKSDGGGTPDLGSSDAGTAALGADALGDANFASVVLSGSLGPASGLTVAVYVPPSSTAGGTGNILNWTGNTGVASQYNVYRCNGSAGACTPTAPPLTGAQGVNSGNPVVTTYTDVVNDHVNAGSTCPATSTCYNTTYYYFVTEVNAVGNLSTESAASNTVSSDVTHAFVVANSQTETYGAANPTPTYTVYSNIASATSLTGVTCAYTPTPSANSKGYYDAGNHPIICQGPTVVSGTTEGITYYSAGSPALSYPSNLTGSATQFTQGSLTVNQLPITVTAVCSTKVYNANTNAGTTCTPTTPPTTAIPAISTNSLVSGDSAGFTESYDTPNVNQTVASHTMTPAGSVNDNNNGNNYKVSFFNSPATSVITAAPLTASIVGTPASTAYTMVYDASAAATLAPANFSISGLQGNSDNFTVTQTAGTYNSPNVATANKVTASLTPSNFAPVSPTLATNYTFPASASGPGTITQAMTTTTISSANPSPGIPGLQETVTVTVTPNTTVANGAGPTLGVAVASNPAALTSTCPTLSGVAGSSSATTSCTLTFGVTASESITATYGGDPNFVGSTTTSPTVLPLLTSIVVAPTAPTSYTGDTVWVNDDYPGQGTVLNSGGSASVAPGGTTFSLASGGISVIITGTNITVTFPNGWTFPTTPGSFDGLVITDPESTITGVSLATPSTIPGYTGSPSQLYFDANDVFINFPQPAFSTLLAGASVSVNVLFGTSAPASTIPGDTEQFTATGIYNGGAGSENLIGLATWSANSTPSGAATISPTGLASAVSTGSAAISAAYGSLFSNTPTLTVAPALVSIAVTPASPLIDQTDTLQFAAIGTYSDTSTQTLTNLVTWASSATGVATINTAGQAAGVAQGTTTISAALGGVTGTMLLTVNLPPSPGALQSGQFMSPYGPVTLSASAGVPPYTFSLGAGAVLPAGITFDASGSTCGSAGSICGTPSQAGQWQVPITVTDSTNTAQSKTLPLTINLASGYAGGSNCTMPYPATPLYYSGVNQFGISGVSAGPSISETPSGASSSIIALEMSVIQNNVLTGCLAGNGSGSVTSGVYTLTLSLNGGASTLPLTFTVVGQDRQDNTVVNVNSESPGADLPPNSNQEGVVAAGSTFTYLPASYLADSGGDLLFGLSGQAPQICDVPANIGADGPLTAPPQAGRYDVLLAGASSCPAAAFPTSPAPIVFESVDVIANPPTGITSVGLSGSGSYQAASNVLEFESGGPSTIPVTVSFTATGLSSNAILVGLNSDSSPQQCLSGPNGSTQTIVMVPNAPGRYYIAVQTLTLNTCSSPTWPGGPPLPSAYIGVVDVWPTPLSLPAASLPAADQNVNYQQTLFASGGTPFAGTGYIWAVTSGALPTGLLLGTPGTVGAITGSPTASPGQYAFGVTVTDSLGAMASQAYSITVNAPPSLTGGTLPNALVGTLYSYNIPVMAGTPPFTNWTCGNCAANLPAGLSFSNGNISGTAAGTGTGSINVSVSDAAGGTATAMYTITADTPPSTPATFSATGSLKTARSNPAVTLLQNGQVLVTGGQSSTGSILASAELYDPNTGVFTLTTGPMNAARWVHTANLLPNGQVLITGGQSNTNPATLASAELYNPATGTFSYTTGPMTTPRSNQTATLLPNGQVLIAGGNTSSNDMSVGPSAELYNPSTGSFTATTGSMGTDRYVANAALLPNGLVLIVGGISIPANTYLSSAELYDPATGAFTSTGSMNSKRGYFTATLLQNGQVLAAGGGNPGQLTTAELYNAGTFSTTGPMSNQQGGPATLLADGQVLFAGGYNTPTSTYLTTSELYNAGSFSLTGPMITARNGAAATLLYDGQVLVVGGANSSGVLGSAELYAPPN